MMASCAATLIKIALFLFNIILLGIGLFLIYSGYTIFDLNSDKYEFSDLISTNFKSGSIALIGFGALIVLIAALGIFGACLESTALLNIYGYIIFFLVIGEIILFYYSFKYKDEFIYNMENGVKKAINQYQDDAKLAYGLQMIQKLFQCCGLNGPNDYKDTSRLPASCCDQMENVTIKTPRTSCQKSEIVFSVGCKNSPFIKKTLGSITYAAYAVILLQLIVILAACCLARDLRTERCNQY
ncbi:hypothetical protein SSS_01445 [Sarcoptes scabiei]|uniref:Tetraspanin n=1 Tax=Sarcoptes scabiei TaxID=52283 RepID=A0A131ZZW3_SARSC|nr:hypothetical protein SSS_01445 [Sarcoptes scabiei]KPM04224.1 tetraspanin-like protein 4 [Sarcoptes scabiei]